MRSPEAAPEPAPRRRPAWLQWVWPVEIVLMVGAAVWALVFHATLPSRLPADDDYRRVAEVLGREARPGDAVLLFPWWTERARLFLPEDPRIVGYLGSDDDPLVKHPRVWVLAQPDLPRSDEETFRSAFEPGRKRIAPTRELGNLELSLFENARHRPVVFSAPEAIEGARVYLDRPGAAPVPCPRTGEAFRCPGGANLSAAPEWHEVLYEPRHCLLMHAPGGAARMVVEWEDATLGDEALLEAGVIWEHAVKKGPGITPTEVVLEDAVSGERLADVVLAPGVEGFQRAQVRGAGARRPLRIAVSSQRAESRQICVDLTAFGGGAGL